MLGGGGGGVSCTLNRTVLFQIINFSFADNNLHFVKQLIPEFLCRII